LQPDQYKDGDLKLVGDFIYLFGVLVFVGGIEKFVVENTRRISLDSLKVKNLSFL